MSAALERPDESTALKSLIHGFIAESLQAKLDDLSAGNDEKRRKLLDEHLPSNWLQSAARRSSQIKIIHFGLKFTHGDAKGSSLYIEQTTEFPLLLGTHSLGDDRIEDVDGNAAALDVYRFLCLSYEEKNLLKRAAEQDPSFLLALSDDLEKAKDWAASFASLTTPKGLISHQLAKQIYFPIADSSHHLLSPMYPASLAHHLYHRIHSDRFSEKSQEARKAMREGQASEHGFCEYPNLAIQKFGGSNTQNISLLNSQRRGVAYLLPSLPPTWQLQPDPPPKYVNSVFSGRFGRRRRVYELTTALRNFLAQTDYNNIDIRNTRRDLIARICDEALQFATEIQQMKSGWSSEEDCKLDRAEQLWLDPERALADEDFANDWNQGDWRDDICSRFGKWLNRAISSEKKIMGDSEHLEWASELSEEISLLRVELDHV
ncbi:type I-F CRISPR-associated protein Csy1 [Chitinimonas lacunae]|uniref:Type I-F CRISPR-associated protein Csy1 n=1 Tax=Chitinimonas lacunae TaxID=1963018 RepID=A0ABV8MPH6_9NEIS